MSATTSATTGWRYGLERVCRTWDRSRSAFYARRARVRRPARGDGPGRRGPTPALSDAQLLAAIRSDLARSPFQGEGHRKVHARLRILDDIRVSRTRVLRVMRAQGLLSPHRGRQGEMKAHDGTIVTLAPDVMWGTDGVRVFTADDGWVWTFAAVDHWNAECVGWHVCKVGNRFAALEPVAQGLRRRYGSVEADVARGLALRMDHGSQYLSDHFLNQLRYWGIYGAPGFLGHGIRENPMSKEVGGMVGSKKVKGAVSARTEGARRASGVGADGAAVGAGGLAPGQRWSASRKRDVVLRLLRGESLDAVSREVGVELYRLEAWQARALGGLERGLKAQAGEPLAAELDAAKRHIGELSMENELLRERARAAERRLPLATRRSRR